MQRKLTFAFVFLMLFISIIGVLTKVNYGLDFRYPKLVRHLSKPEILNFGYSRNELCKKYFPKFYEQYHTCLLSRDESPNILIVGDSHSIQYFRSFAELFPNSSVLNISESSCLPFNSDSKKIEISSDNCLEKQGEIVSLINSLPSLDFVVIAGYWVGLAHYRSALGEPVDLGDVDETYESNLLGFINKIKNKKIVYIKDNPELSFDPRGCVAGNLMALRLGAKCFQSSNLNSDELKIQKIEGRISERFPEIAMIDPRLALCEIGKCSAFSEGFYEPLYIDRHHLSFLGSKLVLRHFYNRDLLSRLISKNIDSSGIDFSSSGKGKSYLLGAFPYDRLVGWGNPEDWGIWSDGKKSTLALPIPHKNISTIRFYIKTFIKDNEFYISIFINGNLLKNFYPNQSPGYFDVPAQSFSGVSDPVIITLSYSKTASPHSLGLSDDKRELAIGLKKIKWLEDH